MEIILVIIAVGALVDIYARFRIHKRNILAFFDDLETRMDERIKNLKSRIENLEKQLSDKDDFPD